MSIVPLKLVTLCGVTDEKGEVLRGLQALGVMHLKALKDAPPLEIHDPTAQRRTETAFRHLREAPEQARPFRLDTPFNLNGVVGEILDNRARLKALRDRRAALQMRIEALELWGDIRFPPLEDLGGQRLWFYVLPVKDRAALRKLDLPWQIVRQDVSRLHVAVISPEEPPADLLPVPRVKTGAVARSVLEHERDDTLVAIEQAEAARLELTRWRLLIGAQLADAADAEDLAAAAGGTLDLDGVFALQGWVPVDAVERLEAFAAGHRLAMLIETPGLEDRPPTLLDPPERFAGGADLTHFYTSPAYRAWDPSLVVFSSFALFFAMIMGDAGYAAVIALITAIFWRRMGHSGAGRRGRVLLAAIAGVSMAYGIACGSYFGLKPPADSFLARLAVVDVHRFDRMMTLSVVVGALHITIALGAVAWVHRGGRAITAIGWMLALWSGIALLLAGGAAGHGFGSIGLAAGLAAVVGGAMLGGAGGVLQRVGTGLLALTGITKLFGDVLSYLRLFALGLASASLATTFNTLAVDIKASHPGLGLVLALIVLAFGHGINFLLGLMSGVVHGLRLNYIEFFSWGLTEEGYPFRAFAKRDAP